MWACTCHNPINTGVVHEAILPQVTPFVSMVLLVLHMCDMQTWCNLSQSLDLDPLSGVSPNKITICWTMTNMKRGSLVLHV